MPWLAHAESAPWVLITQNEFERNEKSRVRSVLPTISVVGAPVIEVSRPDAKKTITAPVSLRLNFRAEKDASIDLNSFRATYGRLGIDITSVIKAHAKLTAAGLVAENASVPSGHHSVTVSIADTMKRVGTRTFEFTVA
jgi:hypothetical protein